MCFQSWLSRTIPILLLFSLVEPALAEETEAVRGGARARQLLQSPEALASWLASRSQDIAASRAQLEQARADARSARLLPNPVLDFSVSNYPLGETNPPGLSVDRSLVYGAGISQLFEIGKRGPRAEAADLRTAASSKRLRANLGLRVADARAAIGRAVYATARQQTLEESLKAARASADVAKGRLEHQALSGVDYDRLLLDLSSLESEAARTRAEADAARATCAAALLANCDLSGVQVSDLDRAAVIPVRFAESTLDQRSDVAALKLESQAAQSDAKLASRRAIPDVTLRLGYTHSTFTESGDNANTLGASIALPLPLFDHGQHDKAKALARADELTHNARATVNESRGDLNGLFARRRTLETTLSTLEKDALPRADSVLRASEKGLSEGQLDMTDLLLARRQAIAVRLQTLDLRFELFTVKNEIRRLLGLDEVASGAAR